MSLGRGSPSPRSAVTLSSGYLLGSTAAVSSTSVRPELVRVERAGGDAVRRERRVARSHEPDLVVLPGRQDRQLVGAELEDPADAGACARHVGDSIAIRSSQRGRELEHAPATCSVPGSRVADSDAERDDDRGSRAQNDGAACSSRGTESRWRRARLPVHLRRPREARRRAPDRACGRRQVRRRGAGA